MTNAKKAGILTAVLLTLAGFSQSWAAGKIEVPMNHHRETACTSCHEGVPAKGTVKNEACSGCHGGMSDIRLPPNRFGKDAHHSPHYADLMECVVCHSEHGTSRSLCEDCHVTK